MESINEIGRKAWSVKGEAARLPANLKNKVLMEAADDLVAHTPQILEANALDMKAGRQKGMNAGLLDRLELSAARIEGIADGLRQLALLEDPVGEVLHMKKRPNGLLIGQKRVPLGVVAVIYEARPNVTADVFGLCFKTGNAVILKSGRDAWNSAKAIVDSIHETLIRNGLSTDLVQLLSDNSREASNALMKLNQYVDVLIPRGGASLIRSVVETATIPVIETGTGNCHVYVDEGADVDMAADIIINGKTQRVGVCNAVESILIHESMADAIMPALARRLAEHHVQMRADEVLLPYIEGGIPATQEDWGTEYLDYIVSMKSVSSIEEAIAHINTYNTGHSEAIVTNDYSRAQKFLEEVDAAAVYVNASTRFTDGGEFGLGAEIGISTQKLHARGPMGLEALTTTKYIIYGNGQIRP